MLPLLPQRLSVKDELMYLKSALDLIKFLCFGICGGAGLQSRASCLKTQNVHLGEFRGTKEVAWFTSEKKENLLMERKETEHSDVN